MGIVIWYVPLLGAVQSFSRWMTLPQSLVLVLDGVVVAQRLRSSAAALALVGRGKGLVELEFV